MGGGTEVYQPTPPAQPSTAEATQAWVNAMPQVYETQMQYAPMQAAQQVALAQQYAPQMGAAMQAGQAAMYPETTAIQEELAGQAREGYQQGMPDWMKEQYRSNFAANLGTNVGSPIGAEAMSGGMLQAEEAYRSQSRNLGLSLAGRQQLAQPAVPTTGQYSQQFTPQNVMGFQAQTYAPFAQASRPFVQQTPGGVGLGILGRWGGSF